MSEAPLALYIHWPFCLAKCPYCDFNSHVRGNIDDARWVRALLAEMRYWRAQTGPRQLASIFFGGGTPSLLPPQGVEQLIRNARDLWQPAPDLEITLEANPTSSEAGKFRDFASAGVNRLSLGVQALDDAELTFLGREHNVAQALAAIEMARATFPRFSFDLIYARKNQTLQGWEAELTRALKLAGTHLSLYQLTIEPGTVFAQKTRVGHVFTAPDELSAEMYERTTQLTAEAGLPMYEVSNYAKPGNECRHNLGYWHYREYVGIGPGAHGRVSVNGAHTATVTHKPPEVWLRQVEEKQNGLSETHTLDDAEQKEEAFLMNLRLARGIDKAEWQQRFAMPLDALLDTNKKTALLNEGLLEETQTHLRVTPDGMLRLNAITGGLLA